MSDAQERRIGGNTDHEAINKNLHHQIDDLKQQLSEARALAMENNAKIAAPVAVVSPAMPIAALMERDRFIRDVIKTFFRKGIHYGVPFPNAKDVNGNEILMLYKDGADWLAMSFGVRTVYTEIAGIEDRAGKFISYKVRCELKLIMTSQIVGDAIGFCSSEEEGYKYRKSAYKCPNCGEETIIRSRYVEKGETEAGWYCNKSKGGCGAKYDSRAAEILNQPKPGRALNNEVFGEAHNIWSKAAKRAFVQAMRTTFGLNAYFKMFEDLDDDVEDGDEAPRVVEGTATRVTQPTTEAPAPAEVAVGGWTFENRADWEGLPLTSRTSEDFVAYINAQYPQDGGIHHAGGSTLKALGAGSWADVFKRGLTLGQAADLAAEYFARKSEAEGK